MILYLLLINQSMTFHGLWPIESKTMMVVIFTKHNKTSGSSGLSLTSHHKENTIEDAGWNFGPQES
jgi:hypothetical protein